MGIGPLHDVEKDLQRSWPSVDDIAQHIEGVFVLQIDLFQDGLIAFILAMDIRQNVDHTFILLPCKSNR